MNNYIYEYYQGIKDGSISVGVWIEKLYSILVDGIESGTYHFNQKKADRAVKFVETFCRHSKGKLAPQTLKLSLWQKAATSAVFGIVDENNKRIFRECFFVVGRKCGKSLLAAAWMTYFCYIEGEFGSELYMIAPKLEQAEMVMSDIVFNMEKCADFKRRTTKRKNDYYIESSNTVFKKVAFADKKSDGYNPMAVCADEISSWSGIRGLRQYEVMMSGMGAREEPLMIAISSAGYENESIYDELFKRSTRFLNGYSQEARLIPFLYMIDDIEKWDDINELRKSLPGLGVSVSVDFVLDQINTANESLSKRSEFITKMCNIKQSSSQAWLPAESVRTCCHEAITFDDFRSCYCVAGIDLSQVVDLTSACVVIMKNGIRHVISHFWLPAEKIDEASTRDGLPYRDFIAKGWLSPSGQNFVEYEDVFMWFVKMVQEYELLPLMVGYDRYSSTYLVQSLNNFGFKTDDVFQGFNMTGTIQRLEGMIRDGQIDIGDNDLLKVHLLNTAVKMDTESRRLKIVKLDNNSHIDGCAALLDALVVEEKYFEVLGEQLKNEE